MPCGPLQAMWIVALAGGSPFAGAFSMLLFSLGTVPLMLGYFIAIMSWNAPDSAIAVWGSMIPFTSPIVMLSRIPFGVPAWQLALSIALLVATFVVMAWLSAKIYRVGILTSGKKAGFKDLWKWLKQK